MSENRVAAISIVVENTQCADKLNALLHDYGEYIIGRMGIPYRQVEIETPDTLIQVIIR